MNTTELDQAQAALQAFADSVEWWRKCDCPCHRRTPEEKGSYYHFAEDCKGCQGTGCILRWPALFEAVYEKEHAAKCARWKVPWHPCTCTGYVRSVQDFWWRLPKAIDKEVWWMELSIGGLVAVEVGTSPMLHLGVVGIRGQHPIFTTLEVLRQVMGE